MKKYDIKNNQPQLHNVLFASTSDQDYDMGRILLLEDMPNLEYPEAYVIARGSHCSCYGFDDTEWYAESYTGEELLKLPMDYAIEDKEMKAFIKRYFSQ